MSTGTLLPTRYAALDVLRGIAILGTLATNIWIFTDPEGLIGYINGTGGDGTPAPWALTEDVLQQLAQGKFLGLLTLMFGIGLEIQRRSAVRAGRHWPGRYPWRAALLFLDGLLNFLLVIEFDVLMGYALTGFVVAYVLATSERVQRRVLRHRRRRPPAGAHRDHRGVPAQPGADLDPRPRSTRTRTPTGRGGTWCCSGSTTSCCSGWRRCSSCRCRSRCSCSARGCCGRACWNHAASDCGDACWCWDRRPWSPTSRSASPWSRPASSRRGTERPRSWLWDCSRWSVEIVRRRPEPGPVRNRLAEVGRMALSCYVLQNLVAGAICYGWGLGLAAALSPEARVPGTIALYLVVVVIISSVAYLWLRRFNRGPLELAWLWCFQQIDRRLSARVR